MDANKITADHESEAAIWAEGSGMSAADILRAYREHLSEAAEPIDIQSFCEQVLEIANKNELLDTLNATKIFETDSDYRIAFVDGSTGDFDCVESFTAANDDAANAYATEKYAGREWYVLNASGQNINGDNEDADAMREEAADKAARREEAREAKAYRYACAEQGCTLTFAQWMVQDASARSEWENGAAGIPTA